MDERNVFEQEAKRQVLLFLDGTDLSRNEVQKLEEKIVVEPENLDLRLQTLGFYEKHYHMTLEYRRPRIDTIVWLIDRMPQSIFHSKALFTVLKTLEPRAYKKIKKLWFAKIAEDPKNVSLLANAAAALLLSELEVARELVSKAQALSPEDAKVLRILDRIRRLETP